MASTTEIYKWLEEVKDPEIPVLSLVDLGVITSVETGENKVTVEMTPEFVGCPALDIMKEEIIQVLNKQGIDDVNVVVSFKKTWTSNMMSETGRKALKEFGLAPPPNATLVDDIDVLQYAACPRCGGQNTELRNPFGPTLCRSIHYCTDCKEAFEQFKPL
jgi:ring-1,2-phenylacetyl-CoA epoxidase subunit PaaD